MFFSTDGESTPEGTVPADHRTEEGEEEAEEGEEAEPEPISKEEAAERLLVGPQLWSHLRELT